LRSVAELLSPRAYAKGLEIAWTTRGRLPTVMADAGRLRQILFNLAGNAIKFTEFGGALLDIEARGGRGDKLRLRFSVADTGPGVPDAQRERIFEPFAQADPAHGLRADSSGLGLAIVRRLAAAHGGAVGLDSPDEGGSRFWFEAEFPVCEAAPEAPLLTGRRVMVASPSRIVRNAARGLIEAAGGTVVACESLETAERLAASVDAVLVDYAFARAAEGPAVKLKPLGGKPSVILLAPEERARIPRYRRAGFGGYLIKPLREASLVERLLVVLGEAQSGAADERAQADAGVGARVLLAEDNPINALLARSLLEREGCIVDRVSDGFEALSAASTWVYDLILMDLRMPGLDGRATAEALRARGCRTPIVALTADAFEEDRRSCLAAGMDDFLSKPLDQGVLRAALRRWTAADWTRAGTQVKLAS
jgi:CheY-like chemotaxis protein